MFVFLNRATRSSYVRIEQIETFKNRRKWNGASY